MATRLPRSTRPVASAAGMSSRSAEASAPGSRRPAGTARRTCGRHRPCAPVWDTAALRARLRAADLEGHHRLARARRLQRGRAELLRVRARFPRTARSPRVAGVVGQVVDEIRQFQIHLVAGGDQLRQADAPRRGARQQRAQDAAALRHHADAAGRGTGPSPARRTGRQRRCCPSRFTRPMVLGPRMRIAAGCLDQLLLAPRAFLAGLGVAAGQHDGRGRCRAAASSLTARWARSAPSSTMPTSGTSGSEAMSG